MAAKRSTAECILNSAFGLDLLEFLMQATNLLSIA